MFRRGGRVRPVRAATLATARRYALQDPVHNALAGSRLLDLTRSGSPGSEFSLVGDGVDGDGPVAGPGGPTGVLWHGVNLSPLTATHEALVEFGEYLAPRPRRSSSVVGPRAAVEVMWERMGPEWERQVREHRWSQPLLVADEDPGGRDAGAEGGPGVRRARVGEESAVFSAAVAMFREEVGIDPTAGDGGRAYGRRVADLIARGCTYVVVHDGVVLFKADVGAVFGPVAQIHGVWVRPDRRGRGLGRAAMSALVPLVRRDHAPRVSLYVNDFNEPARRAYAAAGFRQVGELSTILF